MTGQQATPAREHVFVIAEAGVNHNGDLSRALALVEAAAAAGADAVKFQTFRTAAVVTRSAAKAEYQTKATGGDESQYAMLQQLELSPEKHEAIAAHCRKVGIPFMSTPFDPHSMRFLVERFAMPYLKVPSGEITNPLILHEAAASGLPVILSTGMSTIEDVEVALGVLAHGYLFPAARPNLSTFRAAYADPRAKAVLRSKIILLHCTTEYPAPFGDVNLRAMDTMRERFGLQVGYSDHTPGITVPIAAVARGAVAIEKHFTMDRTLPGPDHAASLEPNELAAMVRAIRETEQVLGSPRKVPAPSELGNQVIARRSLVAAVPIAAGELFTETNLTLKRPGSGVSSLEYYDRLGTRASRAYQADELIS